MPDSTGFRQEDEDVEITAPINHIHSIASLCKAKTTIVVISWIRVNINADKRQDLNKSYLALPTTKLYTYNPISDWKDAIGERVPLVSMTHLTPRAFSSSIAWPGLKHQ